MNWPMQKDLRDKIRAAAAATGITRPDFVELLSLIDQHYEKMEATITQSVRAQSIESAGHADIEASTVAPIEAIFDSVTEALLSVGADGVIRNCNKVCSNYFKLSKEQLVGSNIEKLLPACKGQPIANYLGPYMSDLEETDIDLADGEVDALRSNGQGFCR